MEKGNKKVVIVSDDLFIYLSIVHKELGGSKPSWKVP
jgi:hypothetical protein